VDPYRLGRVLWKHKLWLIGAGVVGVIVGFLFAKFIMTSTYETTAVLRYEGEVQIGDLPRNPHAIGPAADALRHQAVLEKIREDSGFEGDLTALAASIAYEIDPRAGTLHITAPGETGEDAAEFTRLVTDTFLGYHKERQSRRIEAEIARVRKRIEAAEAEAEDARQRYNAFRDQHGIADLSTEQQSVVESAARIRADSELMVSDIRALEAQVRALETQLASTPKTSLTSTTGPERAAYNRLREELASARATLSEDHPQVQALQQQVNQLRSELRGTGAASPAGDGLVAVNATYQALDGQLREARSQLAALKERQKGLSEIADKAQRRVEGFSEIEGEASALLAGVKVNEALVSDLRQTEAALEDALRDPPSGFTVLDPGAVPEYPVQNKMKIVAFAAIPILAVGLVLLLVLQREFWRLRLQTPTEVAFWGNGPVLAATSWPNDPKGLEELVAGLDDFVPEAKGAFLIVGGSPAESTLAAELARRMSNDWLSTGPDPAAPRTASPVPTPRGPLTTPPPSGPYPIGSSGARSTALARRPAPPPPLARLDGQLRIEVWDGPHEGQALRRAARLADRLVVLVRSGTMSALQLYAVNQRLGRQHGIGYIVVGLPSELRALPDRVGDVEAFWRA
jgi:uncharacterized protein involved in exopolysaccharide biosynthesis